MAKILDDTQNLTDLNEELLAEDIIIGKNAKSSLSAGKKIPPDTSSQDRPPPGAKGPTPLKVSNVPSTTTSVRGSAVFKGTHSTGPVLVSEPWVVDSPKNSQREAPRWITRMSSRMSALLRGGSQTLSGEFETSDDMDSLFFLDSFNEEFNEEARGVFERLDENGDGRISEAELRAGLVLMGVDNAFLDPQVLAKLERLDDGGDDGGDGQQVASAGTGGGAALGAGAQGAGEEDVSTLISAFEEEDKAASGRGLTFEMFRDTIRVQASCALLDRQFEGAPQPLKPTIAVVEYSKKSISWWNRKNESVSPEDLRRLLFGAPLDFQLDFQVVPGQQKIGDTPALTRWVNVEGLDALTVRKLAVRYGLDPIAIEDALQVEQRPKLDLYEHGVFVVVPMMHVKSAAAPPPPSIASSSSPLSQAQRGGGGGGGGGGSASRLQIDRRASAVGGYRGGRPVIEEAMALRLETEAVSIFVVQRERTVITVQEKPGDCWRRLRKQMNHGWSKVRSSDHLFLLYALLDLTTDSLFPVLKQVLGWIEDLEDELAQCANPAVEYDIRAVANVKKQLQFMHRMLRPMRSVLDQAIAFYETPKAGGGPKSSGVGVGGVGGVGVGGVGDFAVEEAAQTAKYLRDVLSHIVQILEDVEEGIQECRDLADHYNSRVADWASEQSNKQADVLYVLTFATLFIAPLQLLSGIYGMNFAHIPELEWEHGYAYFWTLSLGLMALLVVSFKRLGWL